MMKIVRKYKVPPPIIRQGPFLFQRESYHVVVEGGTSYTVSYRDYERYQPGDDFPVEPRTEQLQEFEQFATLIMIGGAAVFVLLMLVLVLVIAVA